MLGMVGVRLFGGGLFGVLFRLPGEFAGFVGSDWAVANGERNAMLKRQSATWIRCRWWVVCFDAEYEGFIPISLNSGQLAC
jgi:hypothetical protein